MNLPVPIDDDTSQHRPVWRFLSWRCRPPHVYAFRYHYHELRALDTMKTSSRPSSHAQPSRRKAKSFWMCPRCGRQFVSADKWHSCQQFQIGDRFLGKDPQVRELYDLLYATFNEFGPVTAYALKTRIVFQAETQFAAAMPRKHWLEGYLWLKRRAAHPLIRRVEMQVFRDYGHIFRLTQPADLDDDLVALLHEAYMLGCQPLAGR